ncbi:phospholipase [Ceratobasidium sp. AG-Ba]|nr:phospholipase [Ceratobasidium sp. AG-Ba]
MAPPPPPPPTRPAPRLSLGRAVPRAPADTRGVDRQAVCPPQDPPAQTPLAPGQGRHPTQEAARACQVADHTRRTCPDGRARPREFEDLGRVRTNHSHRRTLSDTSQFIDSVRRIARRSLSSVPTPSATPPTTLQMKCWQTNPRRRSRDSTPTGRRSVRPGPQPPAHPRPHPLPSLEHTPRRRGRRTCARGVQQAWKCALPPSLVVPDSPATYKDEQPGAYVWTNDAHLGADPPRSLFTDSSLGTTSKVDLAPDDDLTPSAGPKAIDFAARPQPRPRLRPRMFLRSAKAQTVTQPSVTREPKIPDELVKGTLMTKVTQKKASV